MTTLPTPKSKRYATPIPYLLVAMVGAIAFIVYYPGLNGPFVFDDEPNIVENRALQISSLNQQELTAAITAVKAGPLGRPLSYLTFALNYYFFGNESFSFKVVNLFIHILTGLSLFVLTQLLLRAHRFTHRLCRTKVQIRWTALAVSTLWLLHPLGLTSVLYIVQRMTSLAALFTILSLVCYLLGRMRLIAGRSISLNCILGFFTFALLAILSKENAALIPYYVLLIEVCLLKFKTRSENSRMLSIGLYGICIFPIVAVIFEFDRVTDWLTHSYELRPFTLNERLLTETRVMWLYIKLIFMPRPSELGLYHDDLPLSTALFTPITTLGSILGLISLLSSAVIFRNKASIFSFGIVFFLIGHTIESSFIPLEIAHEHRNYLPMFGLLLIIGYYSAHPKVLNTYKVTAISGLLILISMYAVITAHRTSQWSDEAELAFSLAQYHPESARSNYEAGRILTGMIELHPEDAENNQKYYRLGHKYFTQAAKADKSNTGGLFGILYLDSILGRSTESHTIKELKTRLSEHPILPATTTAFTNLHKCWVEERCAIDPGLITNLYRTALNNPLIAAKYRASLYNELAIAELRLGKVVLALPIFQKALETEPGKPQIWFNFIQALISAGKFEQASTHIRDAKIRFSDPNNLQRIAKLETQLIRH